VLLSLPSRRTPLQLAQSRHPRAERHVARLVEHGQFDVVHVEHMRGLALARRLEGAPVVYDAVDSISALFEAAARHAPTWRARLLARLDLARSRRFETRAPFLFSRVVVTSQREAAAFVRLAGPAARDRLVVLSNGVDTEFFRPSERGCRAAIVFTGKLSYHANASAAVRLIERIMPRVWERQPDAHVILAGKDPPHAVRALGRDYRVQVTGFVDDMRQVFAEAAVAVCPLVYGAGIQNKVLEAMASGVATVMTPAAAQALAAVEGRDYLACHDDENFAAAILELLADERLRRRLGEAGRQYVLNHHRWDVIASSLVQTYELARETGARRQTVGQMRAEA